MVNSLNEVEIVDVFGDLSSFGAIVNNNGKQEIYMWGRNYYGQLGLGDTTNRLVPTLFDSSKLGNYTSIKELSFNYCAYSTKIIVNTNRGEEIYVFGKNNYGQLGIGNTEHQLNPVLFDTVAFGDYISIKEIQIAELSSDSSYAIISDRNGNDQFFVWGYNTNGKLGIGNWDNQLTPVRFNTSNFGIYTNIKEFRFFQYMSYAILERSDGKNELYTWGSNYAGQLGIGNTTDRSIPTKVTAVSGKHIKFVKIYYAAMFIVMTNNGIDELYTCGDGNNGTLGHGNLNNLNTPTRIPQSSLANATEIITINGWISVAVGVKINGQTRFMAWGNNQSQDIIGAPSKQATPILYNNSVFGDFTEVYESIYTTNKSNGRSTFQTSAYAYVKTASGDKLYTWGTNSYGQLGIGNTTSTINYPTQSRGLDLSTAKIIKFPKTFQTSNILSIERNNQIEYFGTGRNDSGELAQNNATNLSTFTKILPAIANTNPTSKLTTSKLTSIETLNLINSNNVINTTELEKYVDTTSFPIDSTLSIDMTKTTANLEQGILNLVINTNKYNSALFGTITTPKTFEVAIDGLWKATNINTIQVSVKADLFPNKDRITIKKLYNNICNSVGKVIDRLSLEEYLDLTSIPPTAELYLLPNSLDDPIKATFTLKSNQVYLNGVTTLQTYVQPNLTISIEELMNWALIISLSVVGGVLLITALVGFILVKRNSNRIII